LNATHSNVEFKQMKLCLFGVVFVNNFD